MVVGFSTVFVLNFENWILSKLAKHKNLEINFFRLALLSGPIRYRAVSIISNFNF